MVLYHRPCRNQKYNRSRQMAVSKKDVRKINKRVRSGSWFVDTPPNDPNTMDNVRRDFKKSYNKKDNLQLSPMDDDESSSMVSISIPDDVKADKNSFFRAISSILAAAQLFALLPVRGVRGRNASDLRFRWCSLRLSWTLVTIFGCLTMAVLSSVEFLFHMEITFNNSANSFFFFSASTIIILFLQLARNWPEVAAQWEKVEVSMRSYGYPRYLAVKMKIMTSIVMSAALVEHVLSNVSEIDRAIRCTNGSSHWLETYFTHFYTEVFRQFSYSHWKGVLVMVVKFTATFSWNFIDLFVMLLSVALSSRVRQVNVRLGAVKSKRMPENFWLRVREDYNSLSCLTKTVDSYISKIVLLSFGNNLYFICLQLLNTIKPISNTFSREAVYFYWSFGYLLIRTCAVSLFAASIHDESKEPRSVLYSVPPESYCVEVQRFMTQVLYDDVAFTGLNFFSVTRTLMLTVAGTIVTYEIVLVQLNTSPAPTADTILNNQSVVCAVL